MSLTAILSPTTPPTLLRMLSGPSSEPSSEPSFSLSSSGLPLVVIQSLGKKRKVDEVDEEEHHIIEVLDHEHNMIVVKAHMNYCKGKQVLCCSNRNCGYVEIESVYCKEDCNLKLTQFDGRNTWYRCLVCERGVCETD